MNTAWRITSAVVASVSLCGCLECAIAQTSSADWQFESAVNPSVPTSQTNLSETASAEVSLGYLASGWFGSLSGFGTQTGMWDLGFQDPDQLGKETRGRLLLELDNAGATNSPVTDLRLRVIQFVDGLMYLGGLSFSLPGANFVGRTIVERVSGGLAGSWVEDEFQWQSISSREHVSLCVTGAVNGTLVDRVRLDAVNPTPTVPDIVLTRFEKLGRDLILEWTGGKSPYEVLWTTNSAELTGWSRIGLPISETHAQIPLDGEVGYVRVRGSN